MRRARNVIDWHERRYRYFQWRRCRPAMHARRAGGFGPLSLEERRPWDVLAFSRREMNTRARIAAGSSTTYDPLSPTASSKLNYQPLVNLERNEISGFEALLRWRNSEARTGVACRLHPDRRRNRPHHPHRRMGAETKPVPMRRRGRVHIKVAVNLSPVQFKDRRLCGNRASARSRRRALRRTGWSWRSRSLLLLTTARKRSRFCGSSATLASGLRWTISAPAIRRCALPPQLPVRQDQDRQKASSPA